MVVLPLNHKCVRNQVVHKGTPTLTRHRHVAKTSSAIASVTHMEPRVNGAKMPTFIGRSVRLPCRVLKVRYPQKTNLRPSGALIIVFRRGNTFFGRAKRVKQGKLICASHRSPLVPRSRCCCRSSRWFSDTSTSQHRASGFRTLQESLH
jgi:hypothetical protein